MADDGARDVEDVLDNLKAQMDAEEVRKQHAARHPLRRPGCVIALIFWFLFLLTPCGLLYMARVGEFTIASGADMPDAEIHPALKVELIMQRDSRGLLITRSIQQRAGDDETCVQTSVNYILWQGEGDSTQYCECYQRDTDPMSWTLSASGPGTCDAAP